MKLSERIAALEDRDDDRIQAHLRVAERYVARAEEKLLRIEQRQSSWTKPDLRLRMTEELA